MKRLGVNIDHVATVRNARGEFHPDPFEAALYAKKKGANSITIHQLEPALQSKPDVKNQRMFFEMWFYSGRFLNLAGEGQPRSCKVVLWFLTVRFLTSGFDCSAGSSW